MLVSRLNHTETICSCHLNLTSHETKEDEMPRVSRLVVPDEKAIYHVISRTALDGLPFKKIEKDELVRIIQKFSAVYHVDVLGYAVMGNHFHLLVQVYPDVLLTDAEVRRRFHLLYGDVLPFPESRMAELRRRFCSLSEYVKEIKQTFSRFYNKRKNRKGTLWGERFKSVIVQQGRTVIHCLAYIDLNAVRAGIVKRPEDYRWCSMGYHAQTGNKDGFLCLDAAYFEPGMQTPEDQMKTYRAYLYNAGAIERKGKASIAREILDEASENNFQINSFRRLKYRTRYFSDSGIIGSREFVSVTYSRFKDRFRSKHPKKPQPVKGIEGMYSLKRLAET